MSWCPARCHMCQSNAQKECQECQRVERLIQTCRSGLHPLLSEEESEADSAPDPYMIPNSTPTSELHSTFESESIPTFNPNVVHLGPDNALTKGDHLLYVDLPPEVEHICASATTSQRLVEAARRYAKAEAEILEYLREFKDVFAKESFDTLLEWKPWDHTIELEPGSKPTNCKVYPLSPREQVELNAFLEENLCTRRICPSKSPMASPVFFIKKKDGSLQLVQDY